MHMVAVAEIKEAVVVISVEVPITEDSPEVAITRHVDFRIMEGLRTTVIAAGMAEELMEGMAAGTISIITEGMHQEGPYSELFWAE